MASKCSAAVDPACLPPGVTDPRLLDAFTRRFNTATQEALQPILPHTTNGDEALPDLCGTYTKCLKQDSFGIVNPAAWAAFLSAIQNGSFALFEALTPHLGGKRKLNGPMGAWAYSFTGADCSQFGVPVVPVPPHVSGEAYATELIELYWCSLLRDVAFTDYHLSPIAHAAAHELSLAQTVHYEGPKENGKVTPALLFRGKLAGEEIGPYISQFLITPTNFGAAPFEQKYITYKPNIDYMTDIDTWFAVQNGISTGAANQTDPILRYLHDGRGLAAWTHVDELYQAYFTAYLVMSSTGIQFNPTNPYAHSMTENGFGTFGGPDIAAVLAQVAKLALNSVWFQKWAIHLRHRPESGGGMVHVLNEGLGTFSASPKPRALHSEAVKASHARYGTWLLSQPFPEGSPAHPAYPTGHGSVGGACITILKFFFDGNATILNPLVPSENGTALAPWDYNPATGKPGVLTVNGELHKLAHNITFGHGLHGGIHWRSDSDASIALGEAVAVRFLDDLVCSYAEPVNVTITLTDGSTRTFSN